MHRSWPGVISSSGLGRLAVFLAGILIATLALPLLGAGPEHYTPSTIYEGLPLDAKLLDLDQQALDEAYHAQLQLLFSIWLKQQAGDATQITKGLQLARRAYAQAQQQITRRRQELQERP